MQDKKNYLTIGEASEYLGVSIDTLRRWEKKGRITPYRSPGGHRYYEKEELDSLFGKRYTRDEPTASHITQIPPVPEPQIPPTPPTSLTSPTSSSDEEDNIFGHTPPTLLEKAHIPREIRLRSLEPVRVTREVVASNPILIPQVSFKSDISNPLPPIQSTPSKLLHSKSEKKELATTIIILSILILVIILGVILFLMLWSSSKSVLSPTP